MTNAQLFKTIFGEQLTTVWAKSEDEFLNWATAEAESSPEIIFEKNKWLQRIANLQFSYSGDGDDPKKADYRHGVHDGLRIAYETIGYGIDGNGG